MERRVGAAIAGGGLIIAAGLWGAAAFFVLALRFGEYCDDVGSCEEAEPLLAVLQAGLAIAGGVAAVQLGSRLLRYSRDAERPGGLGRRGLVTGGCAALWLIVIAAVL